MRKGEFSDIRSFLGKTQKELAQLLGTSLKAIQSFEQGWRRIPVHVERQVLFLLAHHLPQSGERKQNCWIIKNCPQREQAALPGMGVSFRSSVLVHQRDHMPWQDSGHLAKEDELVQEV